LARLRFDANGSQLGDVPKSAFYLKTSTP
jgi:hypothetical protein